MKKRLFWVTLFGILLTFGLVFTGCDTGTISDGEDSSDTGNNSGTGDNSGAGDNSGTGDNSGAGNGSGTGGGSELISASIHGIAYTESHGGLRITFTVPAGSTGVSSYNIYYCVSKNGAYSKIASVTTSSTGLIAYDDNRSGLLTASGVFRWYRVAAVNSTGEGPLSSPKGIEVKKPFVYAWTTNNYVRGLKVSVTGYADDVKSTNVAGYFQTDGIYIDEGSYTGTKIKFYGRRTGSFNGYLYVKETLKPLQILKCHVSSVSTDNSTVNGSHEIDWQTLTLLQ
ncbi:MAG: hypothetical protein LBG10_06755 [Treponema sp.]|jgi:hypothetical protein|nr:hypothetical protein [Treponema sp.]